MLKCRVLAGFTLAACLAGCTTISVLPGSSTVETTLSAEQSSLRQAATVFNDMATSRGWITTSGGLFGMARVLVDGQDEANPRQNSYADLIGAEERNQDEVATTLITDAGDAASALSEVSIEAHAFLEVPRANRDATKRSDLISFERALVQAQQTRRSFVEAASAADLVRNTQVNVAMTRLDMKIDEARLIADQLANEYSGRAIDGAVS